VTFLHERKWTANLWWCIIGWTVGALTTVTVLAALISYRGLASGLHRRSQTKVKMAASNKLARGMTRSPHLQARGPKNDRTVGGVSGANSHHAGMRFSDHPVGIFRCLDI
jgi:hypothetical protein